MTDEQLIEFKNLSMQDGRLNLQWFADYVAQAEREECAKLDQTLALSPSLFATVAEYNAYKQGVMAYRVAIRARGQA